MVARKILLHKLREDSSGQTNLNHQKRRQSDEVKRALIKMYLNDLLANKADFNYPTVKSLSQDELDQMIDIATKDLLQHWYVKDHNLPKRPLPEKKEFSLTVLPENSWFMKLRERNPTFKVALQTEYFNIVSTSYLTEYFNDYMAANTQEERDKIIKYWRDNKNNMWWNPDDYAIRNKSDYDPWETILKPSYESAKRSKYYAAIKHRNKLG